jgi:methylmalonyl-CoA/ethylmalonyl-CoA epimerase
VPEPSLHHVGYVVPSISESLDRWSKALGTMTVSRIFADPIQRVRVAFLGFAPDGAVQFELVEPASADSPVHNLAEKGGGLHHMCFEVDNLERHILHMRKLRAILVRSPRPAAAFDGRRIAWMLLRDRLLVEYLERSHPEVASDSRRSVF